MRSKLYTVTAKCLLSGLIERYTTRSITQKEALNGAKVHFNCEFPNNRFEYTVKVLR